MPLLVVAEYAQITLDYPDFQARHLPTNLLLPELANHISEDVHVAPFDRDLARGSRTGQVNAARTLAENQGDLPSLDHNSS